ncbi:hypothetical protein V3I01_00645 [Sphingomonas sp. gentR]|jgi:hypothetical protein|uniref:hypothetical protein n=1 Tax=unclassified Sphingomonas TaxID=196159 RepID=UPI000972BBE0|nr:hypothetical protein [Sphingomonas sp. LK11]APX65091.1 hypothetical protein AV944_03675 [Sphingomonas sp. LK11]
MGKKKHKKKQKKAKLDEQPGTSSGPSSLHRIGQTLLDQARSPAGRQLLATGLIVAASALARETTKRPNDGAASSPEPTQPETPEPPQEGGTTKSGMSEVVAFAGMALSALDQFIHRSPSDTKG